MIDVVPSVNLDQQRLDFPHDPIHTPQYFNTTPFATTMPTQPILNIPTSYGFDLTDQQNQSHNTSSQTFTSSQTSNEMATPNGFTGQQQYPDVDNNSSQQLQPPLESRSYVEPPVNYYPTTSNVTTSNSMSLTNNNNLDNNSTNNNYPSRNLYMGNYPQQYLEHGYHNCPTSHPSRIGMTNSQLINYPLRQRIIYQGPTTTTPSIGRNVPNVSNASYSRPENINTTIAPSNLNLFPFGHTGNALMSSFDLSSTVFTTKPTTVPTTIAIPTNSTDSITSPSESASPTKKYSYSGPPKSYYSRLPLYDRPFKCDTCPQSFNRNHDLKRHKRIHLAVKPYPCAFCDKQFSRKDALKRHILVKGCNNTNKKNSNNKGADDDSLTKTSGQSIESESRIKSEPTSDNQNFI